MSAPIPEAYVGEWNGDLYLVCGLCGQRTIRVKVGESLVSMLRLVRAHVRSGVCS